MKPVDQEFTSKPEIGQYGDCQRAAIASVLELPLTEVPHFLQDAEGDASKFYNFIYTFLKKRDLHIVNYYPQEGRVNEVELLPDEHYVIVGPSPRGNGLWHAVVGQNGNIVFDPHHSREGLLEPDRWHYQLLRPIEPVVSDDKDAY